MGSKSLLMHLFELFVTRCVPVLFGCTGQTRLQTSGKVFKSVVIVSPSPFTLTRGCILLTALNIQEIQAAFCTKHLYGFPK